MRPSSALSRAAAPTSRPEKQIGILAGCAGSLSAETACPAWMSLFAAAALAGRIVR